MYSEDIDVKDFDYINGENRKTLGYTYGILPNGSEETATEIPSKPSRIFCALLNWFNDEDTDCVFQKL